MKGIQLRGRILQPRECQRRCITQLQGAQGDSDRAARNYAETGFKSLVLASYYVFPGVPAISRQPTTQRAQAREGEADKL